MTAEETFLLRLLRLAVIDRHDNEGVGADVKWNE